MVKYTQSYINFAFFIIFPLFFLYHVLVAKNYLPPFLGGYFTVMILVNLPFLIISTILLSGVKKNHITFIEILFFILLLYFFLISVVNFFFNPIPDKTLMLVHSIQGILFLFICYVLGKYIDIHNQFLKKIIIFTLIIFMLLIISNLNEYSMFDLSKKTNMNISYQGYARILTVLGFFSIAMIKNIKYSLAIFIVASVALFFNGARTEFVIFNLTGLMYYILLKPKLLFPLIVIFLSMLLFIIFNDSIQQFLLHNRLFELLLDRENSTSGNARLNTIILAVQTIQDYPLFGNYGSYIEVGGIGWYAHSIISAWVDLGLFGFLIYIFMFFLMFLYLIMHRNRKNTPEYKLFFLFYVFVFLAMLVSKNYSYMLFGFLVAFYSRSAYVK
ncbi:MAG TPA: O-antigen ligase domain-containing protein [Sulfurovum sp.]|nr:O-antigen ligase domain-containing protein [Hydrogenothermaceae bacterium]HIQ27489.1 O-antigen ligase domain-containing protein [Sulfurovum sp.]